MNKKIRIAIDVVIIGIALVFLIFGIRDAIDMFKGNSAPDNIKFARIYPKLYENNIYKTADLKMTEKLLKSKSAVILIGDHEDEWTSTIVKPLEDIVKEHKSKIYHLDLNDVNKSLKAYKNLETAIGSLEEFRILIIENKKVIVNLGKSDLVDKDYDGNLDDYFTEERIDTLKSKLFD